MKSQIVIKTLLGREGFTLIEIMLVVVIIGILAAIAIPNFLSFRMKALNSSALSDTKNVATAQELMHSTNRSYGVSSGPIPVVGTDPIYAGSGGGIGTLVNSNLAAGGNTLGLTWTNSNLNNVGVVLGLGQGVSLIASTEIPPGPEISSLASYTIVSKHVNGDHYFGKDSDSSSIYTDQVIGSGSTALVLGDAVVSTSANDDFTPPTIGPSGNNWTVK